MWIIENVYQHYNIIEYKNISKYIIANNILNYFKPNTKYMFDFSDQNNVGTLLFYSQCKLI